MKDEDIFAFNPVPGAAPVPATPAPAARRRRVWPWLLAGLLVLAVLATVGGAVALLALVEAADDGVQLFVDGQPWDASLGAGFGALAALAAATVAVLGIGGALLLGLLGVLLVVPLAVGAVLLALALGLGGALLAVLAVLAVVVAAVAVGLSPLWLLVLLLWWLLRRKPPAAATMPP